MSDGAISWESKFQLMVALSMTDIAMAHACKKATSLKRLLGELKVKQNMVGVNCDSQNAIHLVKNLMFYSRTKHIDIRYHFVRDILDEGLISLLKVHTDANPADILMKSVTREKFNWSITSLCLEAT
uniref:Retrovirus-related Pol polyprotein from transposon TNT 1-94 n=1 Tax=Ananas comosus var. bracteatus TaxID=296719 RepID=A0A6V7P9M1_ANACO|nr:unnamed protein product [Ananas comosus var. bracteatus]